ncbi:MAG: B12-binding domain-containing radical SAM protein [Armatimonadota bacterium]
MKVTLVAPCRGGDSSPDERAGPLFPPLSLMTVAALTPGDVEVEIVDESVQDIDFQSTGDLIGVTATTAGANRAYEIADRFRELGKTVVIGGVHATALPEEAAGHADAVVIGEAEGKWPELIKDFQRGRLRKFYASETRPDPAEIPVPRRDLINLRNYLLADTVQTTRGCPYNCSFCSVTSFFGGTYRARPVGRVVEEVRNLSGRLIVFVDDNIIGQPSYARELFSALRPLGKRWVGQASLTILKYPDLVKMAAESGCVGLFVGMESLSDDTLKHIGKRINRIQDYERAIELLHDVGIGLVASFMFGFDEDGEDVFEKTVDFVERSGIDAVQLSILTPFPGTTLYEEFSRQGRITERCWSLYDGSHVVYKPARMSPVVLLEGLRWAYKRIYSYRSIFRRLGPAIASRPLMWFANIAYHSRVKRWLEMLGNWSADAGED